MDGRRVEAPPGTLDEAVCMDLSKFVRGDKKAD